MDHAGHSSLCRQRMDFSLLTCFIQPRPGKKISVQYPLVLTNEPLCLITDQNIYIGDIRAGAVELPDTASSMDKGFIKATARVDTLPHLLCYFPKIPEIYPAFFKTWGRVTVLNAIFHVPKSYDNLFFIG